MSEAENLTIHVLREIRDEIVTLRTETRTGFTQLSDRVDGTNERLEVVETTLRDLAEQQRFVVRHLSALTNRDRKIEAEVDALRDRVDAIEKRLPG